MKSLYSNNLLWHSCGENALQGPSAKGIHPWTVGWSCLASQAQPQPSGNRRIWPVQLHHEGTLYYCMNVCMYWWTVNCLHVLICTPDWPTWNSRTYKCCLSSSFWSFLFSWLSTPSCFSSYWSSSSCSFSFVCLGSLPHFSPSSSRFSSFVCLASLPHSSPFSFRFSSFVSSSPSPQFSLSSYLCALLCPIGPAVPSADLCKAGMLNQVD